MTQPIDTETMRHALADYCRGMAELTGDGRWSAAAGLLTGKRGGRHPQDDGAALQYAREALRLGLASSANSAALMAARFFARPHQLDTMRDRIRKKLRRELVKSKDLTGEQS